MNLCGYCSQGYHKVAPDHPIGCECGCHHVVVIEEHDKEAWWLPADEPTMGVAVKLREDPRPGVILEYHYREPRPLTAGAAWTESDSIELTLRQVMALGIITREKLT